MVLIIEVSKGIPVIKFGYFVLFFEGHFVPPNNREVNSEKFTSCHNNNFSSHAINSPEWFDKFLILK